MGHKAKWQYFRVVYERKSGREDKKLMLDEFCRNTGYNRKYAIRRLNGAPPGKEEDYTLENYQRVALHSCASLRSVARARASGQGTYKTRLTSPTELDWRWHGRYEIAVSAQAA